MTCILFVCTLIKVVSHDLSVLKKFRCGGMHGLYLGYFLGILFTWQHLKSSGNFMNRRENLYIF